MHTIACWPPSPPPSPPSSPPAPPPAPPRAPRPCPPTSPTPSTPSPLPPRRRRLPRRSFPSLAAPIATSSHHGPPFVAAPHPPLQLRSAPRLVPLPRSTAPPWLRRRRQAPRSSSAAAATPKPPVPPPPRRDLLLPNEPRYCAGRHKLQGASLNKDLVVEDPSTRLMDPETKELYFRSRSQEDEILLLRKQIADASLKELRLLSEKHILERKLADLRMGSINDAYYVAMCPICGALY